MFKTCLLVEKRLLQSREMIISGRDTRASNGHTFISSTRIPFVCGLCGLMFGLDAPERSARLFRTLPPFIARVAPTEPRYRCGLVRERNCGEDVVVIRDEDRRVTPPAFVLFQEQLL